MQCCSPFCDNEMRHPNILAFACWLGSIAVTQAQTPWIHWEAGFHNDTGKAVVSVQADWAADGIPQSYHYWKENLEVAVTWRAGDILTTRNDTLIYETSSASIEPIQLDVKLSHRLGRGPIQWVESQGPTNDGRIATSVSDGAVCELEVFLNETKLTDQEQRHLTTGEPGSGEWDRIRLNVKSVGATLETGTRVELQIAGAPMARSTHKIPSTSDPLPSIFVLDGTRELNFWATKTRFDQCQLQSDSSKFLVSSEHQFERQGNHTRIDLLLGHDATVPSFEFVNLLMEADGFTNLQPTVLLNFREFEVQSVKSLLAGSWNRFPSHPAGTRPAGRPLWESSLALADKSDIHDLGPILDLENGIFVAKHINERRILSGAVRREIASHPAIWKQREAQPIRLSLLQGEALGSDNRFDIDVVGYEVVDGIERPTLWQSTETEWKRIHLPTKRLTVGGRAFDINNTGLICGYTEILHGGVSNRVPSLWKQDAEGNYQSHTLPVPENAIHAVAVAINRRGVVVGWFSDEDGNGRACYWEPGTEGASYQFVDLDTLGVARGINDLDQIVGGTDIDAYLWQSGKRIDLSQIPGAPAQSRALSISHLGEVMVLTDKGARQLLVPKTTFTPIK